MNGLKFTLAFISVAFCAAPSFASDPTNAVVVKAARMLDVSSGKWVSPAMMIVVRDDKIVSAGSNVLIPSGAKVIDLGNKSLLPGLIDMHTHLPGDPERCWLFGGCIVDAPRGVDWCEKCACYIGAGFTTVRDVGAEGYTDIALRDAINAGDVPGPRMVPSGFLRSVLRAVIAMTPCTHLNTN